MSTELVSILIPAYNRAALIGESIRSALAQTHPAIEVVVVDNASTDGTWDEIQALAAGDARVKPFRNPTNIGPVNNWIECARHAQGVYSKILWSDDLMSPNYVERCLPYFRDPSTGFVYTAARIFHDDHTKAHGPVHYTHLATGSHACKDFITGSLLSDDFPLSPGCAIFRTQDLRRNLLSQIPNSLGSDFSKHAIGNDLLLYLLTAAKYLNFAVIQEPLSLFREHPGSISTQAGAGRLVIHYDIVRAFFVRRHAQDKRLEAKLNTLLWLHQRRFDGARYGVHKVADFYPEADGCRFDFLYLLRRMLTSAWRQVQA